jgi:capsular polysaccharide biosynthesis protein
VVGDVIVPISFHHPCARRLNNRQSVDIGPHVATPEIPLEGARHLRGTYYHLVSEFPGHFGHFMTEDLARLWGWELARAEFDDVRLLLSVRKRGDKVPRFVVELLHAYGIEDEQITVIDEPTQVERLVGATPQFHNGQYADPDIEQVWARIAARLVDREARTPERIFVVRPPSMARQCHNGAEVEAEFAAHGFAVVQPGALSISDQATLFAGAHVIAGYGGSGQFNAIFRAGPTTRIVIASESYYASNEWLISAVKGDDYHHFWCRPDVPRGATYESASFHSDFAFDFDRDGAALTHVIGDSRRRRSR